MHPIVLGTLDVSVWQRRSNAAQTQTQVAPASKQFVLVKLDKRAKVTPNWQTNTKANLHLHLHGHHHHHYAHHYHLYLHQRRR